MSKFFAPVPLDFDQAFRNGDVRANAYMLGCHLVAESYRARNTDDGMVTFHVAPFAELCEAHAVTIRRALRAIAEAGWITCDEVEERQRRPWRIRLTGLDREHDGDTTATPELRLVSQSEMALSQSLSQRDPAQEAEAQPSSAAAPVAVSENTDETRPQRPQSKPSQ